MQTATIQQVQSFLEKIGCKEIKLEKTNTSEHATPFRALFGKRPNDPAGNVRRILATFPLQGNNAYYKVDAVGDVWRVYPGNPSAVKLDGVGY